MTITLKSFLQDSLIPLKENGENAYESQRQDQPEWGYKWVYIKDLDSVKYVKTEKGSRISKILSVQSRKLEEVAKSQALVSREEKKELKSYQAMLAQHVNEKNQKYKEKGIFGALKKKWDAKRYGDIDKLNAKIMAQIQILEKKRTGDTPMKPRGALGLESKKELDKFLKSAVPPINFKDEAIIKGDWEVRGKELNFADNTTTPCRIDKALAILAKELNNFKSIDSIDDGQKKYLRRLKKVVHLKVEDYEKRHGKIYLKTREIFRKKNVNILKQEVFDSIEYLITHVNPPAPPSPMQRRSMISQAKHIRKEIFSTETTFLGQLDEAIKQIEKIIELRDVKKIKSGNRVRSYYQGTSDLSLNQCLLDVKGLKTIAEEMYAAITKATNRRNKKANQDLAAIFTGDLFNSYVGAIEQYGRHYLSLIDILQDLIGQHGVLEGLDINTALSAFITPLQRLPRYQLLVIDLLRNIPPNSRAYADIFSSASSIERYVKDLNDKGRFNRFK